MLKIVHIFNCADLTCEYTSIVEQIQASNPAPSKETMDSLFEKQDEHAEDARPADGVVRPPRELVRSRIYPYKYSINVPKCTKHLQNGDRQAALLPEGPHQRADPSTLKELKQQQEAVLFEGLIDSHSMPKEGREDFGSFDSLKGEELTRAIFADAFRQEDNTLQNLLPQRIIVCHRIAREFARNLLDMSPDEMLHEKSDRAFDPWHSPNYVVEATTATQKRQQNKAVLGKIDRLIEQSKRYGWEVWTDLGARYPEKMEGACLLPPPVPHRWKNADGSVMDDYDPGNRDHDPVLHAWMDVISCIVQHLYIDSGSVDRPDLGHEGLQGVLDYSLVRIAFPSPLEIMSWEVMLVEEVLQVMVSKGIPHTREWIKRRYGMQPHETLAMTKSASVIAKQLALRDVEEDKAIAILRVEDALRRAKNALDLRAEARLMQILAIIQGLNRSSGEDRLEEFVQIVRSTAQQQSNKELPMPEIPANLPGEDLLEPIDVSAHNIKGD